MKYAIGYIIKMHTTHPHKPSIPIRNKGGGGRRFLLPLKQKTMPVHDNKGNLIDTGDAPNPTGFVSVSLSIPSVYKNMCGWFWNVHPYVNGFGYDDITGDKIWVVVKNKIIRIYDSPFDMSKATMTFSTLDVLDLEETTYDQRLGQQSPGKQCVVFYAEDPEVVKDVVSTKVCMFALEFTQ